MTLDPTYMKNDDRGLYIDRTEGDGRFGQASYWWDWINDYNNQQGLFLTVVMFDIANSVRH